MKRKKKRKGKKKNHNRRTGLAHGTKSFTGYAVRRDPRRPRAAYRIFGKN
jgi:hypothetical protein